MVTIAWSFVLDATKLSLGLLVKDFCKSKYTESRDHETSQGNFGESRMRMRVLGGKLRVENENERSEGGK